MRYLFNAMKGAWWPFVYAALVACVVFIVLMLVNCDCPVLDEWHW